MGRRRLNGREYKVLFILSLVVPFGLLAAFRLTGILEEPATTIETITLDAIKWEIPRPTRDSFYIDQELNASYLGDSILVEMCLVIGIYHDNDSGYDYHDHMSLRPEINAITLSPNSFIRSANVLFSIDCQPSVISWIEFRCENLSLTSSSGYTAWAKSTGINYPTQTSFSATAEWILLTPNSLTHQMEITYELTYYNGTVYKKVVQPFQLKLYSGYHYLYVDAGVWNIGETSVKVLVDDAEYFTPFSTIVSEGAHRIVFPRVIQVNATAYEFDFYGSLYGSPKLIEGSPESYNITLKITADTHLRAFY